jgi:hypothetical protein
MKGKVQYIGKRLVDRKLLQRFLFKGQELSFTKTVKYVYIGGWYEVQVKGKDNVVIKRNPVKCAGPQSRWEYSWQAKEAADVSHFHSMRVEKNLQRAKNRALTKELDRLAEVCGELSLSDFRYFAEFIAKELMQRRTKKGIRV